MGRRISDPRQLTLAGLVEVPQPPKPTPGSLNFDAELCATLSLCLKETPLSRTEVAAKMSDLTGKEISHFMISAWCAPSHGQHGIPFAMAPAFEAVCGTTRLQALFARLGDAGCLPARRPSSPNWESWSTNRPR